MYDEVEINVGNLLLSLSDAMDLADEAIASHGIRTAFVAWEIARQTDLAPPDLETLFAAALLHDLGALSVEEKSRLHEQEEIDTEPHCLKGAAFLERVGFLCHVAPIVRYHHHAFGDLSELADDVLVLSTQILSLADTVERAVDRSTYILHQNGRVRERIVSWASGSIRSDVIDAFMDISVREDFWLDLESSRLYSFLLHRGPYRAQMVGIDGLKGVSEMFRDIIDFRSRFTATHSSGVARSAVLIAQAFGASDIDLQLMEVAGNVHDLGKLAIPNAILEKPGRLTHDEMQVMRKHTYFTYSVLNTIGGLRQIPEWAAFHHERLDGTGYPFHLASDRLDTGARILAVADVFAALAEDRPYRKRLPDIEIIGILDGMASHGKLDGRIVQALKDHMSTIRAEVADWQAHMLDFYSTQFLSLDSKLDRA